MSSIKPSITSLAKHAAEIFPASSVGAGGQRTEKNKGDANIGQGDPPPKWSSDISEKDWKRMNQAESLDPSKDDQKHLLYTVGVEAEDRLLGRSNHAKDTKSSEIQADLFIAFKNAQAIHPKQSVGDWLSWQACKGVSSKELDDFAKHLGLDVHSKDKYAFTGDDATKKDPEIKTKGFLDKSYGLPGKHPAGNTKDHDDYLTDPHSQPHKKHGEWKDPKKFHLFPDGNVSVTDVNQSQKAGDCYLAATLASIAEVNPNLIKNGIKDNKDGTYKIRMYDPSGREIWVGVDDKQDNGHHSAGKHGVANWSSLYEKAYQKYNSVYHADGAIENTGAGGANNGGFGPNVMKAFTGTDAPWKDMNEKTTKGEEVGKEIQKALTEGRPVTSGTANHHAVKGGVELKAGHAYSVTKAYQKDGKWYVQVRNPWGWNPTDLTDISRKKDNGYVTLSMDQFISCMGGYCISDHAAYKDTGANPHAFAPGHGAGDGDG
jgi:hypothetical protein